MFIYTYHLPLINFQVTTNPKKNFLIICSWMDKTYMDLKTIFLTDIYEQGISEFIELVQR